jgi:hypothetical protein
LGICTRGCGIINGIFSLYGRCNKGIGERKIKRMNEESAVEEL